MWKEYMSGRLRGRIGGVLLGAPAFVLGLLATMIAFALLRIALREAGIEIPALEPVRISGGEAMLLSLAGTLEQEMIERSAPAAIVGLLVIGGFLWALWACWILAWSLLLDWIEGMQRARAGFIGSAVFSLAVGVVFTIWAIAARPDDDSVLGAVFVGILKFLALLAPALEAFGFLGGYLTLLLLFAGAGAVFFLPVWLVAGRVFGSLSDMPHDETDRGTPHSPET